MGPPEYDARLTDICFALFVVNGLLCFLYPSDFLYPRRFFSTVLTMRTTGMLVPIMIFKGLGLWPALAFAIAYHAYRLFTLRPKAPAVGQETPS